MNPMMGLWRHKKVRFDAGEVQGATKQPRRGIQARATQAEATQTKTTQAEAMQAEATQAEVM